MRQRRVLTGLTIGLSKDEGLREQVLPQPTRWLATPKSMLLWVPSEPRVLGHLSLSSASDTHDRSRQTPLWRTRCMLLFVGSLNLINFPTPNGTDAICTFQNRHCRNIYDLVPSLRRLHTQLSTITLSAPLDPVDFSSVLETRIRLSPRSNALSRSMALQHQKKWSGAKCCTSAEGFSQCHRRRR